eukprot:5740207-Amphidinium_carterae.1
MTAASLAPISTLYRCCCLGEIIQTTPKQWRREGDPAEQGPPKWLDRWQLKHLKTRHGTPQGRTLDDLSRAGGASPAHPRKRQKSTKPSNFHHWFHSVAEFAWRARPLSLRKEGGIYSPQSFSNA